MTQASALDLEADEVRNLVDLGFIALNSGLTPQAAALFAGVRAARPQEDAGFIGEALLMMYRGEVGEAAALLRMRPRNHANRVFLGMALMRLGERAQAEQVLREVAATAQDSALVDMARALLDTPDEANELPLLR